MLDVGWSETLLILVIAVFVFGPEDIPKVMVTLGRVFRRFQYIKYALSQQFDDLMREADLDDLRSSVNFEVKRRDLALPTEDFNESEADEEYLAAHPKQDAQVETVPLENKEIEHDEKSE